MEQPTNTYESESTDLQKLIEAYELKLDDLQKLVDMHEPELSEELIDTSKPKPTMGGGRYPLRQRRAPY